MKSNLCLKSFATVPCQQLTPVQRKGRESKGQKMLNRLKRDTASKILIFSDTKDFHVDKHVNSRNNRVTSTNAKSVDPAKRYMACSKFPKKAMLFGFVGSDGRVFPPVWIKGTMDAPMYKRIWVHKVFPILDRTYGAGNYVLM